MAKKKDTKVDYNFLGFTPLPIDKYVDSKIKDLHDDYKRASDIPTTEEYLERLHIILQKIEHLLCRGMALKQTLGLLKLYNDILEDMKEKKGRIQNA